MTAVQARRISDQAGCTGQKPLLPDALACFTSENRRKPGQSDMVLVAEFLRRVVKAHKTQQATEHSSRPVPKS
jgi:hypothetical protein